MYRVLVVDDQTALSYTMKAILTRDGFTTSTASTGEIAMEILAMDNFDVAIIDAHLPDMMGMHLVNLIRPLYPDLAVIIYSGYVGDLEIPEEITVLQKPVDPAYLINLVWLKCARRIDNESSGRSAGCYEQETGGEDESESNH